MRRASATIAAALLLGLGGCTDAPLLLEDSGERATQVVNGMADLGHAAVGLLVAPNGANLCTATLVGSQTLLTGAHCATSPISQLAFYVNGQLTNGAITGTKHQVASGSIHPGFNAAGNLPAADVAVLRLAAPVQGVQPMRVSANATFVGEQVRLVGYGQTGKDKDDAGTKRTAVNTVEQLAAATFSYKGAQGGEGNTCSGDGGSSVLAVRNGEEVIVGIASTDTCALDDNPATITGHAMRADHYYPWIEQAAQGDLYKGGTGSGGSTGPSDTGPPEVTIVSPAPNAQVDPSFAVNATATDDTGIKLVRLLVDGQPAGQTNTAPFQFQVQNQPAGQHQIRVEATDTTGKSGAAVVTVTVTESPSTPPSNPPPPSPPPPPPDGTRGYGEPCGGDRDCQSNLCALDPVARATYCTQTCSLDHDACPAGHICHLSGSITICGPHYDGPGGEGSIVELQGACAVAPAASGNAPLSLLVLALLALLLRPRS